MKYYKYIAISFFAIVILATPWLLTYYPKSAELIDGAFAYVGENFGRAFFRATSSIESLRQKYEVSDKKKKEKIRIMIVPGHEPEYGGAEYRDLKERDMNVELARELEGFFKNNSHYEVVVARDKKYWNPVLSTYFNQHWNEIISFYNESKEEMLHLVNDGTIKKFQNGIFHNDAPANVALRLYGVNKWNNENKIDLAIHVHFNDYPRSNKNSPGIYSGLAIYVPERQFSDSTTTRVIAETVLERLAKYNAVSDQPIESSGVIEEQELIAIGSFNTLDVASMLIEYGYIYEPQFEEADIRAATIKDLAFQTYLGVEDFFDENKSAGTAYDTLLLPYTWKGNISVKNTTSKDILALQTALILEGQYPPTNKSKNDCPRSGTFGSCTISALSNFQEKHGIKSERGLVGEETKVILNNLYSVLRE